MAIASEFWQDNKSVGGNGGGDFSIVGEAGAFVKRVRIHDGTMKWGESGYRRGCLHGIEIEFTDGKKATAGDTSSDTFRECILEIGTDEKISAMSLWGMGDGKWDRTSEITFHTNKNAKFTAGGKAPDESEWKMDVASGLLLGFRGRCGTNIDSLQPVFLKRVVKQYIDQVSYPELELSNTGFLQAQYVDRARAQWEGGSGLCKVSGTGSKTITQTWNNKVSVVTGIELTFKAGIPLIAEGGITTSLEIGYEQDWGRSTTETKDIKWEFEKEMEGPDDDFEIVAYFKTGTQDLAYKGKYNVVTDDDKKFTFDTSGTLKQVLLSLVEYKIRRLGEDGQVKEKMIINVETRSLDEPEFEESEWVISDEPWEAQIDDNARNYENRERTDEYEDNVEEQQENVPNDTEEADEDSAAQVQEEETAPFEEDENVDRGFEGNVGAEEDIAAQEDQNAEDEASEVPYEASDDNQAKETSDSAYYDEAREPTDEVDNEDEHAAEQNDESQYQRDENDYEAPADDAPLSSDPNEYSEYGRQETNYEVSAGAEPSSDPNEYSGFERRESNYEDNGEQEYTSNSQDQYETSDNGETRYAQNSDSRYEMNDYRSEETVGGDRRGDW
ncbi:uncharacterized protein CTRU02_208408 [Colletotrichum truncatum]|uniref:Uncharacterized protein n=1 Tax=Colletotrichum truncatum TaxID=5467 RepID=A0ACC3YW87_COLTU|nr:uncharacterized protein CTRU02_10161 [Colletotrichum truncatum]KAF6787365.1 hypothetical protein CTRU02_10161 [Colletotrichum truncatum]